MEGACEGSLLVSYARVTRGLGRPSHGLTVRLGVPVGGRVRKLRAVGDQTGRPLKREMEEPEPELEMRVVLLLAERAR